ncbi:MAG TPA: hypothetical protein VLI91_04585 [Roseiarcus sp.]|nr:hypothetical protein [Roseiarcus sp.]
MAIPFMRVVPILRIFDVVKADEFYLGDLKPQGRLASPRTPRGVWARTRTSEAASAIVEIRLRGTDNKADSESLLLLLVPPFDPRRVEPSRASPVTARASS